MSGRKWIFLSFVIGVAITSSLCAMNSSDNFSIVNYGYRPITCKSSLDENGITVGGFQTYQAKNEHRRLLCTDDAVAISDSLKKKLLTTVSLKETPLLTVDKRGACILVRKKHDTIEIVLSNTAERLVAEFMKSAT